MLQRANTGYEDGNWSVPAGHFEGGESATAAMVREALEEVGLMISAEDLRLVHVMHRAGAEGPDNERVDFYFSLEKWDGEPVNGEPEKCSELTWFPLEALPENTVGCVRQALEGYRTGSIFSEFGWK